MPRTPPQAHPARPRTVSVYVHHGKEREDQKRKRIASLCIHAWRGSTVSTKVDTYQQPPESVGGGAVWGCRTVGAMGPRHASGGLGRTPNPGLAVCAGQRTRARRHRAPRGEGALLAKHCFASARTPSRQRLGRTAERGLRRVLQPHTAPPNPQQPRAALALALALAFAGAGLQALQSNYVTQPAITSRARIASHSSSIRHTRLIASRRSGSRCHTGNSPASV